MVAVKNDGENWKVVKTRCSRCGTCCKQYDKKPFMHLEDGSCPYLKHEIVSGNTVASCGLQGSRPFACCIDNSGGTQDYCSITLEEVK